MENMFIESKSRYNFEETVSILTAAIERSDWRMIHVHNLQQLMHNNGRDVLPVKVMEVCAPSFAYKLLSSDDERMYSNMMPCRISIYNKENGNTYVSRMDIERLASTLGGVVQEVMQEAFKGAEGFIKLVV